MPLRLPLALPSVDLEPRLQHERDRCEFLMFRATSIPGNALFDHISRYFRFALGRQTVSDTQRRYVAIVHGLFSGLGSRTVTLLVSFVSVPLTVRYLGAERYGAWVTISTAITWAVVADLGLGNSITNAVSEAYAANRPDLAHNYVASAFWSTAAIAVFFALTFFMLSPRISWERVFNVQSLQARHEIGPAVAIAFAIFLLNVPLSVVPKIYGAYQQVALANAWMAAGSIVSLAAIVLVTQLKLGLPSLVLAVSGSMFLVNLFSALWLFGWSKPWLAPNPSAVTWEALRKLTSLGGMFFVIQIAGLILFQTDNLIIAHYLGAAAVTPYSVTWRLFAYTAIFQILATPAYWPAYAEAFSRGDRSWVRRSFRWNLTLTIASTLCLTLPLVAFGRWIIQKWAGAPAVPPTALLFAMGFWSLIYGIGCSQSCILASSSRLGGQVIYSASAAVLNLVVSILLVQRIGVTGAILGTIVAYLACISIPQWIEVRRALQGDSSVLVATCAAGRNR